jgi:hypothetical protein
VRDGARGGLPGGSPRADYARTGRQHASALAILIHPDGFSSTATELAVELLERVRPAAERLGGVEVLARIEPTRCEAERQLDAPTARAAAAELVHRSLA